MSVAVSPDIFALEFTKPAIAVAMLLVPAFEAIIPEPIIPPMDREIWLPPFIPSIMPSEASFIMAVTIAEEADILSVLAYCDIAAIVIP